MNLTHQLCPCHGAKTTCSSQFYPAAFLRAGAVRPHGAGIRDRFARPERGSSSNDASRSASSSGGIFRSANKRSAFLFLFASGGGFKLLQLSAMKVFLHKVIVGKSYDFELPIHETRSDLLAIYCIVVVCRLPTKQL